MIKKFISKNKASLIYLLFLVVVPLLFTSASIIFIVTHEEDLNSLSTVGWLFFYVATVFTMAFSLTPTTFIAITSGFFLGWEAAFFVVPSYLAASWIGYEVANLIDRGRLVHTLSETERVKTFINNLQKGQFWFIFLSRLSPALPFSLMNFVLAALRTDITKFLGAGFLGMLPRTILSIWIGLKAKELSEIWESKQNFTSELVIVILIIISVLGILYLINKAWKKSVR